MSIDDKESWRIDYEATPEKDSEKGYCRNCDTNILVEHTNAKARDPKRRFCARCNTDFIDRGGPYFECDCGRKVE
jgi:hypothetical protein